MRSPDLGSFNLGSETTEAHSDHAERLNAGLWLPYLVPHPTRNVRGASRVPSVASAEVQAD